MQYFDLVRLNAFLSESTSSVTEIRFELVNIILKGPLNLWNTKHIIAEPGTKIIVYLDSFYDDVFINNQHGLKIDNLSVQVEKARSKIIDDLKIYLSHFWDVHQLGWKPKAWF